MERVEIRVGLSDRQALTIQGAMVYHDRGPTMDVLVNGQSRDLAGLLSEALGRDVQLGIMYINTTITEERTGASSDPRPGGQERQGDPA